VIPVALVTLGFQVNLLYPASYYLGGTLLEGSGRILRSWRHSNLTLVVFSAHLFFAMLPDDLLEEVAFGLNAADAVFKDILPQDRGILFGFMMIFFAISEGISRSVLLEILAADQIDHLHLLGDPTLDFPALEQLRTVSHRPQLRLLSFNLILLVRPFAIRQKHCLLRLVVHKFRQRQNVALEG
jgi:hypothetical protein